MRRVPAAIPPEAARRICRVVTVPGLADEWAPDLAFLTVLTSDQDGGILQRLADPGLPNVTVLAPAGLAKYGRDWPLVVGDPSAVQPEDVVLLNPERQEMQIQFRSTDSHHALLLTNRCNSHCLMCSQPPTRHLDPWLVDEALQVIRHIRTAPRSLGLSGGEPLLLGTELRQVLDALFTRHPDTAVDLLTNGRLLADRTLARALLQGLSGRLSWLVPLYGHADFLHDFVVQAPGAFEETLEGLLTLQDYGQAIQLRIVLVEPVLQALPQLCQFIGRNLPFVREVALMACEPIGFALANRTVCEVDLGQWHVQLMEAASALARAQIPFLFMNTPLCVLPRALRGHARRSISDWKQAFPVECETCLARDDCSGLFAWHEHGWRPAPLRPIQEVPWA